MNLARSGAIQGVLAMMAYWLVESFFLYILPWLREPDYQYTAMHTGFTVFVLGFYIAAGLMAGAGAGKLVALLDRKRPGKSDPTRMTIVIVTLLLSIALLVGVVYRVNPALKPWYIASIFLPVCLSLLLGLFSKIWSRRLALLATPWSATIFLLAPIFIFDVPDPKPTLLRGTLLFLPYALAAILLSWLIPLWRIEARNIFAIGSLCALLLAACFFLHQAPRRSPARSSARPAASAPNVILITLDTVRADHLSLAGYERDTTPNLKHLAQEATVYANAVAPGNMTLSSHASIFTGLYPSWHQAHFEAGYDQARPLDTKYPVLPEMLFNQGFDTIGIVSNYLFLNHAFGMDRGFGYYDPAGPPLMLTKSYVLRNAVRNFLALFLEPWQYDSIFRRAEDINDAALTVLDQENAQHRKFFLFLNYMDAHGPYLPPARFATLYPGRNPRMTARHYGSMERQVLSEKRSLSDSERRHLVSQYDGGIAYMDSCIGTLIEQLKQRGLYDNTLLIVTSDHGESFGERSIIGHGLSVYQDEVHVPLIVKYPRTTTPQVIDHPVSLLDLLPTIFDVVGCETPKGIQGRSLLRDAHELVSESFMHPFISKWNPKYLQAEQAIFSGSMKFIESSTGNKELYDLSKDPEELHNLLPSAPAPALETKLIQFMQAAARGGKFQIPQLGSKALENLKSLGYLQ
ncbi:MAG TPA: sulfatase-like hydrolase/transferase [Bryobacteraceae bacterium]|nr:sulfatase-like hydrolase/transferase [Bryobacteraceae bacterium]